VNDENTQYATVLLFSDEFADRLGKAPSAFFQKWFDGVIGSYILTYRRSPFARRETLACVLRCSEIASQWFKAIIPTSCFFKRPVRMSRPFNTFNVASRV
jgi:hypothetical protein